MRPDLSKHKSFTDKIGYAMGQRWALLDIVFVHSRAFYIILLLYVFLYLQIHGKWTSEHTRLQNLET